MEVLIVYLCVVVIGLIAWQAVLGIQRDGARRDLAASRIALAAMTGERDRHAADSIRLECLLDTATDEIAEWDVWAESCPYSYTEDDE